MVKCKYEGTGIWNGRCTGTTYIVSNRTLTPEEVAEQIKKKYENDWNYGRGEWC